MTDAPKNTTPTADLPQLEDILAPICSGLELIGSTAADRCRAALRQAFLERGGTYGDAIEACRQLIELREQLVAKAGPETSIELVADTEGAREQQERARAAIGGDS